MATWSKGTITKWDNEAGYGFIAPHDGGQDVFFHISALANRNGRPAGNESVTYTTESFGGDRRPRAVKVHYGDVPSSPVRNRMVFAGAFLLMVTISALAGRVPVWLPAVYLLASFVSFAMYRSDKARAGKGQWRISERNLHFLELIGGWPGALVAQRYYRHKIRKLSFKIEFWAIVCLHIGFLAWYIYEGGEFLA